MFLTIFLIATITFFLMKLLPGTPFQNEDRLSAEQIIIMNERYGLNDPVIVQYARYMLGIFTGDVGVSFQFSTTPVTDFLSIRFVSSLHSRDQRIWFGTSFCINLVAISAIY